MLLFYDYQNKQVIVVCIFMYYDFGGCDVFWMESYDSVGLVIDDNDVVDCYVCLMMEVVEVCNKCWCGCSMVCSLWVGLCFILR